MRRTTRKPEDIKKILNQVIGKIEKQGPGKKEIILEAWGRVVGEKAAYHSRPVGIKKGVLTIEVDSSAWLYALNLKKAGIIEDIKRGLEKYKIRDIRFRMGDIS